MKGEQWETSKLCFWHGERTEIHGMGSFVEHVEHKNENSFSRQRKMRWRCRFHSLRQRWSRIWTTRVDWPRPLQGNERPSLRWNQISRFLKNQIYRIFLKFPEHCIQDLQSKFLAMKEDAEKQEDKLRFFAQVVSLGTKRGSLGKRKKVSLEQKMVSLEQK